MSDASFEDVLMTCGRRSVAPERARLVSSELLAALRRTGTAHVCANTADTADIEELRRVLTVVGNGILAEVDGNTVNQALSRQVLERYLAGDRLAACAQKLRRHRRVAAGAALAISLFQQPGHGLWRASWFLRVRHFLDREHTDRSGSSGLRRARGETDVASRTSAGDLRTFHVEID